MTQKQATQLRYKVVPWQTTGLIHGYTVVDMQANGVPSGNVAECDTPSQAKRLAALLNSHQALLDAATGEWTSWADNLPALLSYVADMLEGEAQKQNATNYIAPHLRKASKGLRDAIDAAKE